jgi:chemotaxis protein MotA
MAQTNETRKFVKPDLATIVGLVVAIGAICGGLVLEGGKISDIAQVTAAVIVIGGTLGAVLVTNPLHTMIGAGKALGAVFIEQSQPAEEMVDEIVGYAAQARKNSIISLEASLDNIADPFLKKAISLAVDGADLLELRKMMELDMHIADQRADAEAKVFEAAGGYAPTVGIIGAVLGLIQVMKHLENIEEVGRGIAVAFVATVYGVASANLFFLPVGAKIKARAVQALQMKELMLEGVCGMVEGMNPKLIRLKLSAFVSDDGNPKPAAAPPARTPAQTASAQGL